MQQTIEDQFQLKYYRGSLYNVIFLEQFRKYLISMAITLCYALTIIHASIPWPMRNLKALKLLCLEWIISTHDGWKWIYSKYSNDFKMKISRKCRKQLEKWWQFLGKISTCLRLLPHVGNLYSTCFILLSSNYIKWNGIISNFSSWAIIIIFQTLE